ncbi:glycosyltransferase family 4 protein [Pedobacter sp. SD-b]|uniref:Glycosyltransferase family 4 protein n=1 Tax=Pedobacter segetis TaxID=2793069 RepID=A0ABS1BIR6_9SPHI|nr:glycosyltransferase family 1 protein [Pedobacter segetis]MBK0382641.1 glycosyltransferase family 4 protein [Pedobacter segetis]
MKIGFEAKRAFQNFTGLGNYARFVIKTLSDHQPQNKYFLYAPKAANNLRTSVLFGLKNVRIRTAPISFLRSYWRSKGVVKDLIKDKIELYHGLSHELPKGLKQANIKSVVTIHDLIFLRFPHYFKYLDRKIYGLKFRSACKNADKIIAISEQTKRDIIHFFGTDEQKIKVIYQGCDPAFYEPISAEAKKTITVKYNLPTDFLLCVGTLEERKNQLLILKSLKQLPKSFQLVLIGKKTGYFTTINNFIEKNQLQNRVKILCDVPFNDLPSIYQLAKIFIYTSRFEGFGIPILEALNCGIPVIASTGSCLEEAGGNHSIYVSPDNETELAKAILKVWNDEILQEKMILEGKEYALNFREEKIAEDLMRLYKNI